MESENQMRFLSNQFSFTIMNMSILLTVCRVFAGPAKWLITVFYDRV